MIFLNDLESGNKTKHNNKLETTAQMNFYHGILFNIPFLTSSVLCLPTGNFLLFLGLNHIS
jgi:hypothetical protein